jgi:hypothetical protein
VKTSPSWSQIIDQASLGFNPIGRLIEIFSPIEATHAANLTRSIRDKSSFGAASDRITLMTKRRDLQRTADSIHRIVELTSDLPGDSQADAAFRERLELAVEVLSAAGNWQSK